MRSAPATKSARTQFRFRSRRVRHHASDLTPLICRLRGLNGRPNERVACRLAAIRDAAMPVSSWRMRFDYARRSPVRVIGGPPGTTAYHRDRRVDGDHQIEQRNNRRGLLPFRHGMNDVWKLPSAARYRLDRSRPVCPTSGGQITAAEVPARDHRWKHLGASGALSSALRGTADSGRDSR